MLITGTEKTDVGNREARPVIWVRVVARVTRALRAPGTSIGIWLHVKTEPTGFPDRSGVGCERNDWKKWLCIDVEKGLRVKQVWVGASVARFWTCSI